MPLVTARPHDGGMDSRHEDIRLGVLLPIGQAQWGADADPRELVDFAVQAEELGYSSLWVNDFLLTPADRGADHAGRRSRR